MTKPPSSRRNGPEGREVSAEEAARLRELRNLQYQTKIEAAKSKRERPNSPKERSRGSAGDDACETVAELPAGVEGDAGVKANPEPESHRKSSAKRAPGGHSEKHPKPCKKRAEDAGEHEQSRGQGRVSAVDRLLATEEDRPHGWARSLRLEESLFYADREVFDRARTSLPWYRKQLGTIMDWLEAHGVASSEGVLEADMQAFRTEVASSESNGPGDLRDLDIAARIFFSVMVSEDIIAESPMTNIPRAKAAPGRFSVADSDVLRRAIAAANATPQGARDTALVLCLAELGWTPDKFVQLTAGDVDFVTGAVLSRGPSWSGDAVGLLEQEAFAALQRYLGLLDRQPPADQPLWLDDERRPMTAPGVVRLLRRLGVVAQRSDRKRTRGDITVTITITISTDRR